MSPTRREFIRLVGITVASLLVTRCSPFPSGSEDESPRGQLRDCWLRFDWLAEETRKTWENYEQGENALDQLVAQHRLALDDLVAAGELGSSVATDVQEAFAAAAYHVWRSNAPITCYEPVLIDYQPTSSSQLVRQSSILAEMVEGGVLDTDTVAQAQAAIERDIVFLSLSQEEVQSLYKELQDAAGDSYSFPSFDDLDLEITPEAAEAARFLVELLLEQ